MIVVGNDGGKIVYVIITIECYDGTVTYFVGGIDVTSDLGTITGVYHVVGKVTVDGCQYVVITGVTGMLVGTRVSIVYGMVDVLKVTYVTVVGIAITGTLILPGGSVVG